MKTFASVLLSALLTLPSLPVSAGESAFPVPDTVSPELGAMISAGIPRQLAQTTAECGRMEGLGLGHG